MPGAGIEPVQLQHIVVQAVIGNYDIPEIQRGFVWQPRQVALLAESLYRDYPVGSFLIWLTQDYDYGKGATSAGKIPAWIVDGQQRTAALCLLFGQKPYWWDENQRPWSEMLKRYDVMMNVLPNGGEDEDEELEFAIANPVRRKESCWIHVRDVLSEEQPDALTKLAMALASELGPETEPGYGPTFAKVHGRLMRLWNIRNRFIPLVKVDHEPEDVAEIFGRVNQEGTRVKEADVILALVAVKNPGWVRDQYNPFCADLADRGWELDAGVFVRTVAAIGAGRRRLRDVPDEFYTAQSFSDAWAKARLAIVHVIKRLGDRGVLHVDLLPSTNALIPLFTLHAVWPQSSGYSFERALHWFLMASRDGRYGGSPTTRLEQDVRAIHSAPDFAAALEALYARLKTPSTIEGTEFLERYDRVANRFQRLVLCMMLFARGARDWVDGTRLAYDKTNNALCEGFKPQYHHIFARSLLARESQAREDEEINALANITVLNEATNCAALGNKPPARYIREYALSSALLADHFVPDEFARASADSAELEATWSVSRYDDFITDRAELLALEANAFLHRLQSGNTGQ